MMTVKNAFPNLIIDGSIFNSLSTELLTEIGLTPYQLGLKWYKRSGNKYINSLVEAFVENDKVSENGVKILGQLFSDTYYEPIHRLALALNSEYNPIENYDRTEETTNSANSSSTSSISDTNNGNISITNNVSAFDSTGYQPNEQQTNVSSTNSNHSGSTSQDGTETINSRIHGNIGITTNQQMINEEIRLRTSEQIADLLFKFCDKEFCLKMYD